MQLLFRNFSHPGGNGSHATPEVPGSLHEVSVRGPGGVPKRGEADGGCG